MSALRKASEAYFHTPTDVQRYVLDALAIVESSELDDDLRVPAFVKAVELLAQKHVQFEQVSPLGVVMGNAHGAH